MGIRNKFPARSSLQPEGGLWNARSMFFPWRRGFYHGMFDKLCIYSSLSEHTGQNGCCHSCSLTERWSGSEIPASGICHTTQAGQGLFENVSACRAPCGSVTVRGGFLGVPVGQQKGWKAQSPMASMCALGNCMCRLGPAQLRVASLGKEDSEC